MVQFIADHRAVFGVEPICAVLPIAPSTYHRHRHQRTHPTRRSARAQRDDQLRVEIQRVYDAHQRGKRAETGMTNNGVTTTDLAYAVILWKSADALRGQIDAAEYKHVVLGLLFLKYISDSFEARRGELKGELEDDGISGPQIESLLETRDEYTAERVF